MQALHGVLSRAIVMFTAIAGLYGLYQYFRKQPTSPSYWGIIVVGNLTTLGQGAIGLLMALSGAQAREWVHIVYEATVPGTAAEHCLVEWPHHIAMIGTKAIDGVVDSVEPRCAKAPRRVIDHEESGGRTHRGETIPQLGIAT